MTVETLFVDACVAKLKQLTGRIGVCISKLTDDQIWARGNENENAVGNLVLHLIGNVRQRAVSALGGAPDVRERELEFNTTAGIDAAALTANLNATMDEATAIVAHLTSDRLMKTYEVQGLAQTGVEMLLNVVEHFGQHAGQIIYATKHLTGAELGLTIPRKK